MMRWAPLLLLLAAPAAAQEAEDVNYWASISSGEALMRTGPGKTYPATWKYQRRDLPVKITQRYDNWRKITDPDGETGWMAVALLSERRTGMIRGDKTVPLYVTPDFEAPIRYRAEPGVVGQLDECNGTFCLMVMDDSRDGWVSQDVLWGVDPGETFE